MDWNKLYEILDCDQVTGLQEFLRQLDERFVKREEFEEHSKWLLSQQTAAWDRIMDHSHSERGDLVFPPMVGTCSPIEEKP